MIRYGRRSVAEQTLELAAELRRALVADLRCGRAGISTFMHHQHACLVQPDVLEVLQRRRRGHRLKVRVKCRKTHPGVAGERANVECAGVFSVNAIEDAADLAEMSVGCSQGPQVMA